MSETLLVRGSWVLDPDTYRWIPKEQFERRMREAREYLRLRSDLPSPQIMRDIEPFRNIAVDGAEISSRSQKREMMKRHGLVEVGNEKRVTRRKGKSRLPKVRDSIKRTIQQLT